MARVTSKLQVTVPKALADRYSIRPGDEIDWLPAGDGMRVVKRVAAPPEGSAAEVRARLALFDRATERQKARGRTEASPAGRDRGWTREDLYRRGRPR